MKNPNVQICGLIERNYPTDKKTYSILEADPLRKRSKDSRPDFISSVVTK